MRAIEERNFHILMGGLFLSSLILDPALASALPSWNPPAVTFITLGVGLVWIGRYAAWRIGYAESELRGLRHRLDELEDRQRELAARSEFPRPPHERPWP